MGLARAYVACDIGGSGGRTSIGRFDGKRLSLESVSTITNGHINMNGTYYWDFLHLMQEIRNNLRAVHTVCGQDVAGIGIDTMGVNFGLLDRNGQMLANPLYTRTPQEREVEDFIFSIIAPEELFRLTGLQLTKLNSLYHVARLIFGSSPTIRHADQFLMLPDLMNYMLTGRAVSEYTIASTSHLLNAQTGSWDRTIIERFGLHADMFCEVVKPGTVVERLSPFIADETGLQDVPVIATASHDTASALAFVPVQHENYAYISSGTWGMMGRELERPLLTETARLGNFANEGAASGRIRFLHNSVNLWILKECKKTWDSCIAEYTWDELTEAASGEEPFTSFIDPQDPAFLITDDMPEAIRRRCAQTGQPVPGTVGSIVRVIYESLALKYAYVFDNLGWALGRRPEVLHIVGGGGRDPLLSQCIADALGIPVVCGPYEATVMGNILMQLLATGEIASRDEGLEIIKNSCEFRTYEPKDRDQWVDACRKYEKNVLKKGY